MVHYKVVLPNGYDPAKAYPAILAFGGGPQTMNTVDNVLSRNLRPEAEKRGYIVIAPAAPDDQLFFENGARIFPEFLKMILADYKIQDNKFHIARTIQRRHRRIPRRGLESPVLFVGDRLPGIYVAAQHGETAGDFEDVRLHVCWGERTNTGGTMR